MHIRCAWARTPQRCRMRKETLSATYGKFTAEPFERGFGNTVGNGLRRILLSSLEGSAVTQIKVHNAQHEFTTVPGVLQDITDVVLNVKSLVVKNHSESTKVLRVERTTAGDVLAGDIETDESVEIINADHVLATLTDDVPFVMEMVVENGRGYVPATEHSQNVQEIGIIPVDAIFSPVLRVRYDVEETRVGQKTNYDRLTVEIWTDGSANPEMALVEVGQDSPQAPQPVRAIFRAGPPGSYSATRDDAGRRRPGARRQAAVADCGTEAFGPCRELPGVRGHFDRPGSGHEDRGSTARGSQLRRNTLTEVQERLRDLGLHLGMRLPAAMPV